MSASVGLLARLGWLDLLAHRDLRVSKGLLAPSVAVVSRARKDHRARWVPVGLWVIRDPVAFVDRRASVVKLATRVPVDLAVTRARKAPVGSLARPASVAQQETPESKVLLERLASVALAVSLVRLGSRDLLAPRESWAPRDLKVRWVSVAPAGTAVKRESPARLARLAKRDRKVLRARLARRASRATKARRAKSASRD